MTEIQKLIRFLQTGKRKGIALNEYISILKRNGSWSKKRESQLLQELSMSKAFMPNYKKIDGKTIRYLKLSEQ